MPATIQGIMTFSRRIVCVIQRIMPVIQRTVASIQRIIAVIQRMVANIQRMTANIRRKLSSIREMRSSSNLIVEKRQTMFSTFRKKLLRSLKSFCYDFFTRSGRSAGMRRFGRPIAAHNLTRRLCMIFAEGSIEYPRRTISSSHSG